jgi:hypothetical protein
MVTQHPAFRQSPPPGIAKRILRRPISARTARLTAHCIVLHAVIGCTTPPASAPRPDTPICIAPTLSVALPVSAPPHAAAAPATAAATAPTTEEAVFEAICGRGNAAWENGRHGCIACPSFTASGESASPAPATNEAAGAAPHVSTWSQYELRGSFTHSGAREMVVTLGGTECEGQATNYGGTLLLDLTAAPRIAAYEQGFVPSECKPHPIESGRTALLCRTGSFALGVSLETVKLRDFSKPWDPRGTTEDVFTIESDEGNVCGLAADTDQGPFIAAHILSFDWADANQDGKPDVTAALRYAVFTGTAAPFKKHCANQAAIDAFVRPRQTTARLDFEADGAGKWSPTPATKVIVTRTRGPNTSQP